MHTPRPSIFADVQRVLGGCSASRLRTSATYHADRADQGPFSPTRMPDKSRVGGRASNPQRRFCAPLAPGGQRCSYVAVQLRGGPGIRISKIPDGGLSNRVSNSYPKRSRCRLPTCSRSDNLYLQAAARSSVSTCSSGTSRRDPERLVARALLPASSPWVTAWEAPPMGIDGNGRIAAIPMCASAARSRRSDDAQRSASTDPLPGSVYGSGAREAAGARSSSHRPTSAA